MAELMQIKSWSGAGFERLMTITTIIVVPDS
jgi:hypothetical protein